MQKVQIKILKDNYTGRPKIEPGCLYKVIVPKDTKGNWQVELDESDIMELINRGLIPYQTGENYRTAYSKFLSGFKVSLDSNTFELNLKDPYDKLRYQVLTKSGIIAESESKIRPSSKGYVYIQEVESEKMLGKIKTKTEAFQIVEKSTLKQKKELAALLDKRTRNLPETVITSTLMTLADQDPQRIVEQWKDPDREYKALIKLGILENIIKRSKGAFYVYGSVNLGTDVKNAVEFIKKEENSLVLATLIEDVIKAIG